MSGIQVRRSRGTVRWRGYLDISRPKRSTGRHPSIYEPVYINDSDSRSLKVVQGDGAKNWMSISPDGAVHHWTTKTDAQLYLERYWIAPEVEA